MLKVNKKTMIITSLMTLLPVLAGVYYWDRLPDLMATHFGADSQPDGFTSKPFAVFGLPAFMLAIHWFGMLVILNDPRKQNISQKMFTLVLWIVPLISLVCGVFLYSYNLGYAMDMNFFAGLLMGVMFTLTGNYLPKARQNYTIGIKIPWTLANEENWNRTHRLAGYIWMVGGIIILLMTLTGKVILNIILMLTGLMVIIPSVYSFLLHARHGL